MEDEIASQIEGIIDYDHMRELVALRELTAFVEPHEGLRLIQRIAAACDRFGEELQSIRFSAEVATNNRYVLFSPQASS